MARPRTIDREAVLAAAMTVADAGGLADVTMAAVARTLAVSPMALYRHVTSKEDLLDGLVELALRELVHDGFTADDEPLPLVLRRLTGAAIAVARRHPHVFPLLLTRPLATESALEVRSSVHGLLRACGAGEHQVLALDRVVTSAVLGLATGYASRRFSTELDEAGLDVATTFLVSGLSAFAPDGGPASDLGPTPDGGPVPDERPLPDEPPVPDDGPAPDAARA